MDNTVLEVNNLKKYFSVKSGWLQNSSAEIKANDGISLSVKKAETFGLVGESGCGKSTLGRTIARLQEPTDGKIILNGQDITSLKYGELKSIKKDIQIIFQDPYSSLNPRRTVEQIIGEPLLEHKVFKKKNQDYYTYLENIMDTCGLSFAYKNRYPHQFSGGQRQRIGIARALVLKPSFIVCDEPVSALDVSIQSQIINLFMKLQEEMKVAYLFISHDLSVVKHISHTIGVMYLGRLVELSPKKDLFNNPLHPYTKTLLSAVPDIKKGGLNKKIVLKGEIPSNINLPGGCRFHSRCRFACDKCRNQVPEWREVEQEHFVSCHKV